MFLGDFHLHSTWSDGRLSLKELVDLYGQNGFGAIAITDHLCESQSFLGKTAHWLNRSLNEQHFQCYLESIQLEAERAWELYRMVVVPGIEITKNALASNRSAHILALGISQWIDPDQDVMDILEDIRSQGALSVAAHPVDTRKLEPQTRYLWSRREELGRAFDAWEVASGPIIFDEVLHSGLPLLANSDLHVRSQLSSWKTALSCERHPEAILSAIRQQNLEFKFFHAPSLFDKSPVQKLAVSLVGHGSQFAQPIAHMSGNKSSFVGGVGG